MSEKEKIILPPRYYQDYFNYLVDFIEKNSPHCLGDEDKLFIQSYRNLTNNAQCLFIRMLNRRGEFFRLDKLQYEEIQDYDTSLELLSEEGFITIDDIAYPEIFGLFTKAELSKVFPEREYQKMYKEEILSTLIEDDAEDDYMTLAEQTTLIRLLKQEQVDYLKFLFFGHNYGMMTEFVIRDIGNIKLENLDKHEFTPWFDSQDEAVAAFELSKLSRSFRLATQELLPEEISALMRPIDWQSFLQYPGAKRTGDRLMLKMGEYFERAMLFDDALYYFSLSDRHPARERRIRLYEKKNDIAAAREIAETIIDNPYNATELLFAKDFMAKKSIRNYRTTTARIKESPEISIIYSHDIKVEDMACEHFTEQGYESFHTENYLWRGLFGLTFWDLLFDESHASFHHPLQRQPSDLYNEEFYLKRENQLHHLLKELKTKQRLKKHINIKYQQKEGIANPMVGWHESLLPTIEAAIKYLPLKGLYSVLLQIAKNVKYNSAGFPDLFIWKEKEYHFYEIKSPNDHLSAQQLFWIDFMQENGINADVLRVQYNEN